MSSSDDFVEPGGVDAETAGRILTFFNEADTDAIASETTGAVEDDPDVGYSGGGPGYDIGEEVAQRMVDARDQQGGFGSLEELLDVDYFGPDKFTDVVHSFEANPLQAAYSLFAEECECGESFDNNCAHYLSNALIKGGFDALDGGDGALFREHTADGVTLVVCKAGRPVRAKELRDWFATKATDSMDGEPSDDRYWAVFQHDPNEYEGGHVAIHKHAGHSGSDYDWAGTGDYPSWETQAHYTW